MRGAFLSMRIYWVFFYAPVIYLMRTLLNSLLLLFKQQTSTLEDFIVPEFLTLNCEVPRFLSTIIFWLNVKVVDGQSNVKGVNVVGSWVWTDFIFKGGPHIETRGIYKSGLTDKKTHFT